MPTFPYPSNEEVDVKVEMSAAQLQIVLDSVQIWLGQQETKIAGLILKTEELMARLTMVLESLEPDAIVTRLNAATTQITRPGSVAAAARPLVAEEVTKIHFSPGAIKSKLAEEIDSAKLTGTEMAAAAAIDGAQLKTDAAQKNIKAMPDTTREVVTTEADGIIKQRVLAIQRKADTGALEIVYLGA